MHNGKIKGQIPLRPLFVDNNNPSLPPYCVVKQIILCHVCQFGHVMERTFLEANKFSKIFD